MERFFKNVMVIAGILLLSTIVFYLKSGHFEFTDNVLHNSLRLLGQQLLNSLPENDNKQLVARKWQEFSKKASNGEVAPEKVERVAVTILNASSSARVMSSEDANLIIDFAMDGEPLSALAVKAIKPAAIKIRQPKIRVPAPSVETEREYAELAREIQDACTFNENVRKSQQEASSSPKTTDITYRFHYTRDDGIQISYASDKSAATQVQLDELNRQITLLDKRKLSDWNQTLASDLQQQSADISTRLDSLQEALEKERLNLEQQAEAGGLNRESLERLQALKVLHALQKWHAFDFKQLQEMVDHSIKKKKSADLTKD